ncbi:hypothetical protein BASA81_006717 [Batrachochytrium salamandrivorans]|nr:hypothetical protein BASA81_006717 [Batrachochytrium salamandrivorans]
MTDMVNYNEDLGPTYATPAAHSRERQRRMSILSQAPMGRFSFLSTWTKQSLSKLLGYFPSGRHGQEIVVREPTFDVPDAQYGDHEPIPELHDHDGTYARPSSSKFLRRSSSRRQI